MWSSPIPTRYVPSQQGGHDLGTKLDVEYNCMLDFCKHYTHSANNGATAIESGRVMLWMAIMTVEAQRREDAIT